MPISVPSGPPQGPQIVERHLSELGLGDDVALGFGEESIPAETPAPLPLWKIGIAELAQGGAAALEAARQEGWHYIVANQGPAPLVELSADEEPQVLGLTRGAGDRLSEAAVAAEESVDPDHAFEARVLDLRPVGMMLLWLHSDDADDQAVDLGTDGAGLQDFDPLFEQAVRRAREKLAAATGSADITEQGG